MSISGTNVERETSIWSSDHWYLFIDTSKRHNKTTASISYKHSSEINRENPIPCASIDRFGQKRFVQTFLRTRQRINRAEMRQQSRRFTTNLFHADVCFQMLFETHEHLSFSHIEHILLPTICNNNLSWLAQSWTMGSYLRMCCPMKKMIPLRHRMSINRDPAGWKRISSMKLCEEKRHRREHDENRMEINGLTRVALMWDEVADSSRKTEGILRCDVSKDIAVRAVSAIGVSPWLSSGVSGSDRSEKQSSRNHPC